MSYELTVINPSGNSIQVPLDHFPFSMGRHSDNHLILRDSRVSRKHALIHDRGGELWLEDLVSLHGVQVNHIKVTGQVKLAAGDVIDFGLEDGYRILIVEKNDAGIRQLMGRMPGSAGTGASELSKLRALTEVARSLEHAMSTQDVLATVIEAALTVTGCERGFLLLERDGKLSVELGRDGAGRPLDASQLPVPVTLIQKALRQRKELLSFQFDPMVDWSSRFNESMEGLELRSALCVPLLRLRGSVEAGETMSATIDDTVGLLYMDSRLAELEDQQGNRELLQTLALEASSILENARLLEEERKRHRLEQELALARTIQANLLPRKLVAKGFLKAVGSSIPTHQVGGDFYDVLRRPDGSWLAAVADVSGKGVGAALLASLLQGVLLEAASAGAALEDWLPRLNGFLIERTEGEKYATIFACVVEAGGRMSFVNAGHSRPFILHEKRPGGASLEALDQDGFPVGLIAVATYEAATVQLEPGDTVVLFSDGVEEGRRGPNEFFGRERIADAIVANGSRSLQELHDGLRGALSTYLDGVEPHDDATLLLLRYEG